jgi:hypothetical protein
MALHEKPMFDIKEKGKCKYCNKALTGQQNQNYFKVRAGLAQGTNVFSYVL